MDLTAASVSSVLLPMCHRNERYWTDHWTHPKIGIFHCLHSSHRRYALRKSNKLPFWFELTHNRRDHTDVVSHWCWWLAVEIVRDGEVSALLPHIPTNTAKSVFLLPIVRLASANTNAHIRVCQLEIFSFVLRCILLAAVGLLLICILLNGVQECSSCDRPKAIKPSITESLFMYFESVLACHIHS